MRLTVISDSHRNKSVLRRILNERNDSRFVFFLGDGAAEIQDLFFEFPDKKFFTVSGNCDIFSVFPTSSIEDLDGTKIFYTHGHTLGVKHGIDVLIKTAKAAGCIIALYGHTHVSQILYENGLYIVNPGSCSEPREGERSYAVIDITEKGIMPIIIKI